MLLGFDGITARPAPPYRLIFGRINVTRRSLPINQSGNLYVSKRPPIQELNHLFIHVNVPIAIHLALWIGLSSVNKLMRSSNCRVMSRGSYGRWGGRFPTPNFLQTAVSPLLKLLCSSSDNITHYLTL